LLFAAPLPSSRHRTVQQHYRRIGLRLTAFGVSSSRRAARRLPGCRRVRDGAALHYSMRRPAHRWRRSRYIAPPTAPVIVSSPRCYSGGRSASSTSISQYAAADAPAPRARRRRQTSMLRISSPSYRQAFQQRRILGSRSGHGDIAQYGAVLIIARLGAGSHAPGVARLSIV